MYIAPYILVGKYRRFGRQFCLNLLLFNPENKGSVFVFQYFGDALSNCTDVYYIVFTTSTAVRDLTLLLESVLYFWSGDRLDSLKLRHEIVR